MTLGGLLEYTPGESWPHRLDARVKLLGLAMLAVAVVLIEDWRLLGALWLLALSCFVAARVPWAKAKYLWLSFPILFLALGLSQGIFYHKPQMEEIFCFLDGEGLLFGRWQLSWVSDALARFPGKVAFYAEGFRWGLMQSLRCVALLTAGLGTAMTTHPSAVLAALRRLRLPFEFALLTAMTLRFVPLILSRAGESVAAQRARGLDWKKLSAPRKLAAGWRSVRTVLFSTLQTARETALAMDLKACRAPGIKPTELDDLRMRRADWLALAVLVVVFAGLAAVVAA